MIRLALVPGEPAGIGPEITAKLAQRPFNGALTAFADPDSLREAAHALGLPLRLVETDIAQEPLPHTPGSLAIIPMRLPSRPRMGRPDPAHAAQVLAALTAGADACRAGRFDALVTGPVQKSSIAAAGYEFTGVTGFLAERTGVRGAVMMLANPQMRVALVTTHLPLRAVADAITSERLERTLRMLHSSLQCDFAIAAPRIAVLGLNPHAGEDGHLGREEIDVTTPVLSALRNEGMRLTGPLPADTAFLPARLKDIDAVLAMYHDQGLPVLKHNDFAHAVNITLGLPFVRVAVDHGTALDIAGCGCADPSSLYAAVDMAAAIARRRS